MDHLNSEKVLGTTPGDMQHAKAATIVKYCIPLSKIEDKPMIKPIEASTVHSRDLSKCPSLKLQKVVENICPAASNLMKAIAPRDMSQKFEDKLPEQHTDETVKTVNSIDMPETTIAPRDMSQKYRDELPEQHREKTVITAHSIDLPEAPVAKHDPTILKDVGFNRIYGDIMSDTSEDANNDVFEFNDTPDDEITLPKLGTQTSNSNDIKGFSEPQDQVTTVKHSIEPETSKSPEVLGTNEMMPTKIHLVRERKQSVAGNEENCWQVMQKAKPLELNGSVSTNLSRHEIHPNENIPFSGIRCSSENSSYDNALANSYETSSSKVNLFCGINPKNMNSASTVDNEKKDGLLTEISSPDVKDMEGSLQAPKQAVERALNALKRTPLNTNKYAHQCPYCRLWKLKSTFDDHVIQCETSSTVPLITHQKNSQTQSSVKAVVTGQFIKKGPASKAKNNKTAVKSVNNVPYSKSGNKNQMRSLHKKSGASCAPSRKRGKFISESALDRKDALTMHANDVETEYNSWEDGESKSFSWDFEKHVLEHFHAVRNSTTGFDVTLACWDAQNGATATSQAHRMLLSAASPVLRTILYVTNLKQQNAFVYLNGVGHRDIRYILHFIYKGEARIPLQHLSSFIAAARLLKLKGIPLPHSYKEQAMIQ